MPYIQNHQVDQIGIEDLQLSNSQTIEDNYQQDISPAPEGGQQDTSFISQKSVQQQIQNNKINYDGDNYNQEDENNYQTQEEEETTTCNEFNYRQLQKQKFNHDLPIYAPYKQDGEKGCLDIKQKLSQIKNKNMVCFENDDQIFQRGAFCYDENNFLEKQVLAEQAGNEFQMDQPVEQISEKKEIIQRNIVLIDCADEKQVIIRDIDIPICQNNKINFLTILKAIIERQISYYFLIEDEIVFYSYDKARDVFIQVPFEKGEQSLLNQEFWKDSDEIQIRYNIIKQFKSENQIKAMEYKKEQEEKLQQQKQIQAEQQIKENQIVQQFLDSLLKKKPIKREKERTIEFAVENVNKWRNLQQQGYLHQGIKINLNLNQAAYLIEIRRKTLDEYHKQIKEGQKNGFNFQENKLKKIGVLRKFNLQAKQIKANQEHQIISQQIKEQSQNIYGQCEQRNLDQIPKYENSKQTDLFNKMYTNNQQNNDNNQQLILQHQNDKKQDNLNEQHIQFPILSEMNQNQEQKLKQNEYEQEQEQKLKNSDYDEDYALQMQFDQYSDISMDQQQKDENEQFQHLNYQNQTGNILENLENYDDSQCYEEQLNYGIDQMGSIQKCYNNEYIEDQIQNNIFWDQQQILDFKHIKKSSYVDNLTNQGINQNQNVKNSQDIQFDKNQDQYIHDSTQQIHLDQNQCHLFNKIKSLNCSQNELSFNSLNLYDIQNKDNSNQLNCSQQNNQFNLKHQNIIFPLQDQSRISLISKISLNDSDYNEDKIKILSFELE